MLCEAGARQGQGGPAYNYNDNSSSSSSTTTTTTTTTDNDNDDNNSTSNNGLDAGVPKWAREGGAGALRGASGAAALTYAQSPY